MIDDNSLNLEIDMLENYTIDGSSEIEDNYDNCEYIISQQYIDNEFDISQIDVSMSTDDITEFACKDQIDSVYKMKTDNYIPENSDEKSYLEMFPVLTEEIFRCTYCEKEFDQKPNFNRHVKSHILNVLRSCSYCGKKSLYKLVKHLFLNSVEHYICNYCGKEFRYNAFRERSYKQPNVKKLKEKLYTCDYCQNTFTRKSNLGIHIKLHTGGNTYHCQYCEKKFNQKSNLNTHLKLHAGIKSFQCDNCGKTFSRKSMLDTHMLTHNGKKPYWCNYCGRTFNDKSNTNKHIRTHMKVKIHACNRDEVFDKKSYSTKYELLHNQVHFDDTETII